MEVGRVEGLRFIISPLPVSSGYWWSSKFRKPMAKARGARGRARAVKHGALFGARFFTFRRSTPYKGIGA
jgi:hypothetical protein